MISFTRLAALLASASLLLGAITATEGGASADDLSGALAIIVHPDNAHEDSPDALKQLVKQLFLKQRTSWPAGADAKPFSRSAGSKEHSAFLKGVLEMTEADLAQHWVAEKQKSGATPPREVSSAHMILKLVQKYDGALAVMKTEEAKAVGDAVRILFTFDP